MSQPPSRRYFLQSAAGASLGLGEWAGLLPISPATAREVQVSPELVGFGPDIEPLVKLIEETPRDKCVAMMVEQLKSGLPYRNFLAALYLTNIRTGEVDHPLAVLHSANQLSLDLPVQERLLPIFWALDSFKAHHAKAGGPKSLKPLAGKLPDPDKAEEEFHAGMTGYDPGRAE